MSEARDLYEVVANASAEGAPPRNVRVATCKLSDIHIRLDELEKAAEFCRKYLELARPVEGLENEMLLAVLQMGGALLESGRHQQCRRLLEEESDTAGHPSIDPQNRVLFLKVLAEATSLSEDKNLAAVRWLQATQQCQAEVVRCRKNLAQLQGPNESQTGQLFEQLAFHLHRLSECYFLVGRKEAAIQLLDKLLKEQQRLGLAEGERETRSLMAELYRHLGNHPKSYENLTNAIEVQKRHFPRDTEGLATLYSDLIADAEKHGVTPNQIEDAQATFNSLAQVENKDRNIDIQAFCVLNMRDIYSFKAEFDAAIPLAKELIKIRRATVGANHRDTNGAQVELGILYARTGRAEEAVQILQPAIASWENIQPPRPLKLASILSKVGFVYKEVGEFEPALQLLTRVLNIHEEVLPSNHPQLVTSYENIASCHLAMSQFHSAIAQYENALAVAQSHGEKTEQRQAEILLKLAKAYRSQGLLSETQSAVEEAFELHGKLFGDNSFALSGHFNALASIHRAQARRRLNSFPDDDDDQFVEKHLRQSTKYAYKILDLCKIKAQKNHILRADALNHLAAVARLNGKLATAKSLWTDSLSIAQKHNDRPRLALIHNNLGQIASLQNHLTEADQLFTKSLELYGNEHAFQMERYGVLSSRALNLYKWGRPAEAGRVLNDAIDIAERPRAESSGAEGNRAKFLSQFQIAYETLVNWRLQEYLDGGELDEQLVEAAFQTAERSRNRTFMDLLSLTGTDLRETVLGQRIKGEPAEVWLVREEELRLKIKKIRTRARQTRDVREGDDLKVEFESAQSAYAEVWTEIRNASPVYRELLSRGGAIRSLQEVRESVIDEDSMMLMYFVGSRKSWLLVFGPAVGESFVIPLELNIDSESDYGFTTKGTIRTGENQGKIRGFVADKLVPKPNLDLGPPGPLTDKSLRKLVANNLRRLKGRFRNPDPFAELERPQATLGNILIPKDARELIKEFQPKRLVIVPDGALHQIPFESLVLNSGAEPEFVLDSLPPISYAPSANILMSLMSRDQKGYKKLVSVGNPSYPQWGKRSLQTLGEDVETARNAYLDIGGSIPPLPGTGKECAAVANFFGKDATTLVSADATEGKFVRALSKTGFVHIAAHGLVDETHENLFGSLALTPGQSAAPDDDGFLAYSEILSLPLIGCELAALSACETNVGPERPMESGSTIAQAFLAAGARRVIASLWCVSDDSTAILMANVFKSIRGDVTTQRRPDYVQILQASRKIIRNNPKYTSPYYWAPFVLLGPSK